MKYKAVIFDLDNTLYNEVDYFETVLKAFSSKSNIEYSSEKFHKAFTILRLQSKNILKTIIADFFQLEFTQSFDDILFDCYHTTKANINLYDGAEELFNFLQQEKIKIGLVTNGVISVQKNKIENLNIQNNFAAIQYAREWGNEFEKPNAKPFETILQKLNCDFKDCLFVGDNPKTDFQIPHERGGTTVRILKGTYKLVASNEFVQHEINNIFDVKEFL